MKSLFKKIAGFVKARNYIPKAVCLAMAVILWVILSQGRADRVKYTVPIEIRRLPAGHVVSAMSNRYAQVVLEGSREELRSVDGRSVKAYVLVNNPSLGSSQRYAVHLNQQSVPETIYVGLSTRHVFLTVEKKEHRLLRIIPRFQGNMRDGLVITDLSISPGHVTASGPQSVLADAAFIFTDGIRLESDPGPVEKSVTLDRDQFPDTDLNVKSVKVSVTVEERENGLGFEIPLIVKNRDRKYRYVVDTPVVRVYCAPPGGKINPKSVTAFIDTARFNTRAFSGDKDMAEDFFDAPVTVTFAGPDVELISVVPDRVTVRIVKK